MEEKSLKEKVIEDLAKTGFGSEMYAMKVFLRRDWHVSGSPSYFDLDEEKTRESDIKAHHPIIRYIPKSKKIMSNSFFSIVAEVKKSTKPWIIFKENPKNNWRLQEGWTSLVYCAGLAVTGDRDMLTEIMMSSSFANTLGWFGYGIHEAFKKPNQTSQWYSSFLSVCKAGEETLKANSASQEHPYLFFVKPVVILDGILMSAFLDSQGKINAERIKAGTVEFSFYSKKYDNKNRRYLIDVITLKYLNDYLKFCEERHEKMANELM